MGSALFVLSFSSMKPKFLESFPKPVPLMGSTQGSILSWFSENTRAVGTEQREAEEIIG